MISTEEVIQAWRDEYGWEWDEQAEGYALVVTEQRLGKRKSLSYRASLAHGKRQDRNVRDQIRAQVDVTITRLTA